MAFQLTSHKDGFSAYFNGFLLKKRIKKAPTPRIPVAASRSGLPNLSKYIYRVTGAFNPITD